MFRTVPPSPVYSNRWQETWARLLAPLTLWICVSVTIRYGYFGNSNLVLGPNSSRLLKASSIFVERIQVRDDAKKGLFLYGFSEKPELSLKSDWNVSTYIPVGTYKRRGFSLWLNKGSRITIKWTVHTGNFKDLSVDLIKGEEHYSKIEPSTAIDPLDFPVLHNATYGNGQAEYEIGEDDSYYIGVMNMNPRNVMTLMNVNISSMMYDTSKAESKCSTMNGLCQLKLLFPNTHYVILTTPNNGDADGWYIELSFIARLVTYIAILGFVVLVISLILRYLGACDGDRGERPHEVASTSEVHPLVLEKTIQMSYGTGEEDAELGRCSSSEDLYDGKICVICYDEPRNCFFVPCGHCATCYDCAQRIMDGESKLCPICRRFIHKRLCVRRNHKCCCGILTNGARRSAQAVGCPMLLMGIEEVLMAERADLVFPNKAIDEIAMKDAWRVLEAPIHQKIQRTRRIHSQYLIPIPSHTFRI